MSTIEITGIIGLVLGLGVLITLVYKKIHPIFAAICATLVVGIFNLIEPWTVLTIFANGVGAILGRYLFLFLFATIYGVLMSATGCANKIALFLIKLLGKKSVIVVILLSTGILVYGGVSAMVVVFTIYPIGVMLIKEANISKKFLPAFIAMGQGTFALTALPGTPQLNNIIPCAYLGTKPTAAPVLGIIAAIVMFTLGTIYLTIQVNKSKLRGEGFEETSIEVETEVETLQTDNYPKTVFAFLPLIILMGLFLFFDNATFGSYSFSSFEAINTAMLIAIIYLCLLGVVRNQKKLIKESLAQGSVEWITPLLNFSIVVGFGSVIQNSTGFTAILNAMLRAGGSSYIIATITVCLLAGVTGSASGGLQITLSNSVLVDTWVADATINLSALHRIISVASCSLDSLPHCGGILAVLEVCHETHARSYKHIFVVTVLVPLVATAVIVALAMLGLTT
jgi:H+/gluconate symporter-like permease